MPDLTSPDLSPKSLSSMNLFSKLLLSCCRAGQSREHVGWPSLCRGEPLGGAWPEALQRGGHILCPAGPAAAQGLRLRASRRALAQ